MQAPASATFRTLRMWWPLVLVMAVAGALVGAQAAANASYTATALLRVHPSGNETQSTRIVATALKLVDSDPVYVAVFGDSPDAANELRGRTTVAAQVAEMISVTVAAPTARQAARDTEAVAGKAVEYVRALGREQLETATRFGDEALAVGGLRDPEAEFRRRQALGNTVGEVQQDAQRAAALLTRIGGVQTPTRAGLPVRLAGPVGALVGALGGAAVALLLGVRWRPIRSVTDLRAITPDVTAYGPDAQSGGIARVAARCARLERPLTAVLALPGAGRGLEQVSTELKAQLGAEGIRWITIEAEQLDGSTTNGQHPRDETDAKNADLVLVTGFADAPTVPDVAVRADVVLLVAKLGRTRLGELASVCEQLAETSPVVVLLGSD